MSRNSSVRSSFSYKTEEDFKDEILDLKRQLARIKEESKLLKVKLRRSEEYVARKEKIICTMIDPMKAHLSAKSARDHNKVAFASQKRGSLVNSPSASKIYCQGLCSRAYRHNYNSISQVDYSHSANSTTGLPRNGRKKKGNLKVATSVECLVDFNCDSSKPDLFSYDKLHKNSHHNCIDHQMFTERKDKIKSGTFVERNQKGDNLTAMFSNKINSDIKIKREKNISKRKKSGSDTRDCSYQLYLNSESSSSSPSLSSKITENKRKARKGIDAGHSGGEIPLDYITSEQCRLKAQQTEIEEVAACSIENLILEGKKLLSLWNDNELDSNKQTDEISQMANITEIPIPDDKLQIKGNNNKFGMYLINEGDEQEGIHQVLAENKVKVHNNCKDTGTEIKSAHSHARDRRGSIFRVDIKKKEPKVEDGYIEELDSFREMDDGDKNSVVGNVDTNSIKDSADLVSKRQDSFGVGLVDGSVKDRGNIKAMENMMESLSISEQLISNNSVNSHIESGSICASNGQSGIENSGKSTCIENKSLRMDKSECDSTNYDHLYCGSVNCCRTILGSEVLYKRDTLLHKGNTLPIHKDLYIVNNCEKNENEEAVLLNMILQSDDAAAVIHTM